MSKQYIFRAVDRNIRWTKNRRTNIASVDGDILVQVIDAEYDLPDCFFYLKADKVKNSIFIKDIVFKGNENVQDYEVSGYLKGYFGFQSQKSIDRSLISLQKILNDIESLPEHSDTVWYGFTKQFSDWFEKKLKPCLEKELELYKIP